MKRCTVDSSSMAQTAASAEPETGLAERTRAPPPKRDDPRYNGDYMAFRKDYKLWHTREARRRQDLDRRAALEGCENVENMAHAAGQAAADAQAVGCPRIKKPRGYAPLADGVACTWDGEAGCWRTASGDRHDGAAARKAAKRAFFDAKKAEEAAVKAERPAACARIEAEVHALLKDSAWCSSMGLERCLTDSLWMHEPYGDNDFSTSCR